MFTSPRTGRLERDEGELKCLVFYTRRGIPPYVPSNFIPLWKRSNTQRERERVEPQSSWRGEERTLTNQQWGYNSSIWLGEVG